MLEREVSSSRVKAASYHSIDAAYYYTIIILLLYYYYTIIIILLLYYYYTIIILLLYYYYSNHCLIRVNLWKSSLTIPAIPMEERFQTFY